MASAAKMQQPCQLQLHRAAAHPRHLALQPFARAMARSGCTRRLQQYQASPQQHQQVHEPISSAQQVPQVQQHQQSFIAPSRGHEAAQSAPLAATAAAMAAAAALALGPAAGVAQAAGLDAAGAHAVADFLRPMLTIFTFLFIVRIPMTWYPELDINAFPWNAAFGPTEPVLSATRKVVPLVGGVDITPIIWVGLLSFFSEILLGPQGLLVLIERQGGL